MLSVSLLVVTAAIEVTATPKGSGMVRKADQQQLDKIEAAVAPEAAPEEASELEAAAHFSTHCGDGDDAEYECVLDCMEDKKCRNQPAVVAAIRGTGVFKTEAIQDGSGFTVGAPCASFYGDNVFKATFSWGKSMSTKMTYCAKGDNDASECVDGLCVAHNDDVHCTGDSWKDGDKCKIRHRSCGDDEACFKACMADVDCRKQVIAQGAATAVLNDALQVRCVQEEGGEKRCFFTPGNPCSDTCQDSYDCYDGLCKAVSDVAPVWAAPGPSSGLFSGLVGGSSERAEQSSDGNWWTPW